jgi:hypothetical protein
MFKRLSRAHTPQPLLFTSVGGEIESEDALVVCRTFQYLAMTQRAARIVVPGTPMLLHAQSRELVVLGMTFIVLCPIDQMNDVVDLVFGDSAEQPRFRTVLSSSGILSSRPPSVWRSF